MNRLRSLVLATLLLAGAVTPAATQAAGCPAVVNSRVNAGWSSYRSGDLPTARQEFEAATRRCPGHVGARTGLGYVALQSGELLAARRWFNGVLEANPNEVDALVGLGLVAWREGDLPTVRSAFTRVRRLDPGNADAREYLARIPEGIGPAPKRPPLVLPDTVVYPARAVGDRFEIRTPRGWRPFYSQGVNIGAALPGSYASEFPDSATYARWLAQIGAMGANTVRVYTMHPPRFYQALRTYNRAHPDRPLWLIHGVWAELPPGSDYEDPEWEPAFFGDIHAVVDILHGRADLPPRPGHASGHYTADVSPWTLGFILGREWEEHSVLEYNALPGKRPEWSGRYLRVSGGNAMDAWMAKACEEAVAYEMRTYRAQRPVAYTNWPTTDPLHHPTEATLIEEVAIRRALGERVEIRPALLGDDAVSLDPSLVRPTAELPAGYFASYHVYPYYPDFMVLDPEYGRARSPFGPSNYSGYLRQLKQHHRRIPVLISEYGIPTSLGIAHMHPQGWHHGGLTEAEMAAVNARMTREIAEAGMAGGILFEWIDEWFKKTWITQEFAVPLERNRLWHNRMDAEQHYGVIAMEASPRLSGATLAERLAPWRRLAPLYATADGSRIRALADEQYLHVLVEAGSGRLSEEILLGFDMLRPDAGDFRWPDAIGDRLPVGIEYALRISPGEVRMLVDRASDPVRLDASSVGVRGVPTDRPAIARQPPGFFRGRYRRELRLPLVTQANDDGRYDSLRVLTSRSRFGRDSTEYAAMGYDWGVLREGPAPDGSWERLERPGVIEVRIPWTLLGVTDPSSRRVLQDPSSQDPEGARELGTVVVPSIGIVAAVREPGGAWRAWPASGRAADVARFTWPTWEQPEWRARTRPVYDVMRQTWRTLDPSVTRQGPN